MLGLKPYIEQKGVFESGDLKKSFHSSGLNKQRTLSGGGSGYRSEARKIVPVEGAFSIKGYLQPTIVVKTIIYYSQTIIEGETKTTKKKSMSKSGYITREHAFKLVPFTYMVVYEDRIGNKMTVTNTNIR